MSGAIFTRLLRDEELQWVDRARKADQAAKDAIILHCCEHVRGMARMYAYSYNVAEVDELVNEACVLMLERFHRALATDYTYAYLIKVGRDTISKYSLKYRSIISTPRHARAIWVESLDQPRACQRDDSDDRTWAEVIADDSFARFAEDEVGKVEMEAVAA